MALYSARTADEPNSKKQKIADDEIKRFFKSWAWKREHRFASILRVTAAAVAVAAAVPDPVWINITSRQYFNMIRRPDKERFRRPYKHTMAVPGSDVPITISIRQKKFGPEGFASTVWDSAIVAAKYIEKWPQLFAEKRCCDLSAGCGLVAVVLAKLGASVTATDLEPNLPLLRDNCKDNGVADAAVVEHRWGCEPQGELAQPFDVIVACDVMYIHELVPDLLKSLLLLSHQDTTIFLAHGRNRPAESSFKAAAAEHFKMSLVSNAELDDVYQCNDVDVLRLRRLQPSNSTRSTSKKSCTQPMKGVETCESH